MKTESLGEPGLVDLGATSVDETRDAPRSRDARRYYRSCAIGGVLAMTVFIAVLAKTGGILTGSLFSGFYEIQARSLRGLHWNVPAGSLGIEAFRTGSKYYEYYGPWPAVLRIPLMILFPSRNGHWTQLSMMLALAVALVAASRLGWRIRGLVRGSDPLTRAESWAAGIFVFALGAGSVLLFLSSQAWVYHEAEMWGAALALAAFDPILAFSMEPTRRRLVAASVLSCLAVMSRPSVGFGPVVALLVLAAVMATRRTRQWAGLDDHGVSRQLIGATAGAALVPIALYMYVNWAKFGSLFVFPSTRQIFSTVGVYRVRMLAQNHNSLFGFKFFPTALLQYLRPDALQFRSLLPWVDFPRTAPVIGNVLFDTIEPTSSVPSSMPLFAGLGAIGLFAILRPARATRSRLPLLRVIVLGGFAGAFTVIPYSYIAQRYMSDFIPLLVVASLAGLHMVMRWAPKRPRRIGRTVGVLALVAIFSVWVNAGLAYSYHYESGLVPEGLDLANYVEQQYSVHQHIPGGAGPYVERGDTLPYPPSARGAVFVVGDCAGVYWSQGNTWEPTAEWYALARTEATGEYRLRMRLDPVSRGTIIEPVIVRGDAGRIQTIAAFVTHNRIQFAFWTQGHDDLPRGDPNAGGFFALRPDRYNVGPALLYHPGETYDVTVTMDANNGAITVVFAGYIAFALFQYQLTTPQIAHYVFPTSHVTVGRNDVHAPTIPKFLGQVKLRAPERPEICDKLGLPGPKTRQS